MFSEELVQELRYLGARNAIDASERFSAQIAHERPAWMSATIIVACEKTGATSNYTQALLSALGRWDAMPEALHDWSEAYRDLGHLAQMLSLVSAEVLESMRGGARLQWRIRELMTLWTAVRPGRTPRDTGIVRSVPLAQVVSSDFSDEKRESTDVGIAALGLDVSGDTDAVDGNSSTQILPKEEAASRPEAEGASYAASRASDLARTSSGRRAATMSFEGLKGEDLITAAEQAVDAGSSMRAAEALWAWLANEDLENDEVLKAPRGLFEAVELVAPAPGLLLALLRLQTERAVVADLAYPVWRSLVAALQETGGSEVELNMAVEMALTWGNEAGIPDEQLADLHEMALEGKTQAGRWASAAWHAVQLPEDEAAAPDPELRSRRIRRLLSEADDVSVLEQLRPAVMRAGDPKLLFAFAQAAMRFSRWDVGEEALSLLMGELSDEASEKLRSRLIADLATIYEQKATAEEG